MSRWKESSSWLRRLQCLMLGWGLLLAPAYGLASAAEGDAPLRPERSRLGTRKGAAPSTRREDRSRRSRVESRRGVNRGRTATPSPGGPATTATRPRQQAPWKPSVVMSQQHADACLAKVGDAFPTVSLEDLHGQKQPVITPGKHYTLVVFWNAQHRYALEQYQRLAREVLPLATGSDQLRVVAINAGDKIDDVRKHAEKSDARIVNLWDRDRQVWHTVATDRLPRSYLVDPSGKIVWLDNEYSLSTARELDNAVRYVLRPRT